MIVGIMEKSNLLSLGAFVLRTVSANPFLAVPMQRWVIWPHANGDSPDLVVVTALSSCPAGSGALQTAVSAKKRFFFS